MSKNTTHTKQVHNPSALDRFDLAFEYDVTWSQARKAVKERTA
jgi:hypothetical protein